MKTHTHFLPGPADHNPNTPFHVWSEFPGLVFEMDGYGGFTLVNPYTGDKLHVCINDGKTHEENQAQHERLSHDGEMPTRQDWEEYYDALAAAIETARHAHFLERTECVERGDHEHDDVVTRDSGPSVTIVEMNLPELLAEATAQIFSHAQRTDDGE